MRSVKLIWCNENHGERVADHEIVKFRKVILTLAVVLELTTAVELWLLLRKASLASPISISAPIRVRRTLSLTPGGSATCAVLPPQGKYHGLLTGQWTYRGAPSAGKAGIRCLILAPDNTIVRIYERASSGSFALRYDADGGYMFCFADSNAARPGVCVVDLDGGYQPD
ncbi:MAG TPA: hypothetical protein VK797_20045 [Tepidisphaeraceae bacterium]|jgi:hypothetical protein|nr:hypothetical protein [Tepidisphaeraceae bacterium]